MDAEKIILPDFVIADIYKNHLIEPTKELQAHDENEGLPKKKSGNKQNEVKQLAYLGDNKKKIVVVVNEENSTFINDSELTFLTKILSACNLNVADIAIINLHKTEHSFDELSKSLKAEYILLFGVEPASLKLPFSIPNFQVQQFSNCTIFTSPSLSAMLPETAESKTLKRQLWASLQKTFNLL